MTSKSKPQGVNLWVQYDTNPVGTAQED